MALDSTPAPEYLKLVAARAAENVPQVAARVQLDKEEWAAFALTEHVCTEVAAGRRA